MMNENSEKIFSVTIDGNYCEMHVLAKNSRDAIELYKKEIVNRVEAILLKELCGDDEKEQYKDIRKQFIEKDTKVIDWNG